MNASDDRGISVVREKIKTFSQSKAVSLSNIKCPDFKIIILDEADSMTVDAQSALRRIIEDFTETTRFCIICNYVSKIIDPISSRCAKFRYFEYNFRFNPLTKETQSERLKYICSKEGVEISDEIIDYIISITDGDLRRSINLLQSISQIRKNNIDKSHVDDICGIIPSKQIKILLDSIKSKANQLDDIVNDFISEGFDVNQLIIQLSEEVINNESFKNIDKAEIAFLIAQAEKKMIEGGDYHLTTTKLLLDIKYVLERKN